MNNNNNKKRALEDVQLPPPATPSQMSVNANIEKWKGYVKAINEMIQSREEELRDKALKEEIKEYENEGEAARLERSHDFYEWTFEPVEGKVQAEDIKCCGGECWYRGNLDRLCEYGGSYRFIGTSEIYLCDQCISGVENEDLPSGIQELMFETLVEHCTHDWDDYYGECKECKKPCEHEFCIDRCEICGYDRV